MEVVKYKRKLLFEFIIACPKYNSKELALLNNVNKWYRFLSSKIKNGFKDAMKEWNIPNASYKYERLKIDFHLLRHNKKILDADALGFPIKWTIDAIKESGWLKDDNQVRFEVIPSIYNPELTETSIQIKVYEYIEEIIS